MTCSRCSYQYCHLCGAKYSGIHFNPLNLFGCPGLQSNSLSWIGNDSCCGVDFSCGCGVAGFLKRIFFRISLLLLYVIGVAIGLPILIIFGPILMMREYCRNRSYRHRVSRPRAPPRHQIASRRPVSPSVRGSGA